MSLDDKIREAHDILDEAWYRHIDRKGKECAGIVVMFSGGNDSGVLAHLMRERATHFGHANTGIGIEQTRQFVRDQAKAWGVPLLEECATGTNTFRSLVLDQGFPGPAHHAKMFQRLKERQFRKMRAQLVSSRGERVIFVAGRRSAESARRTSRWIKGELVEHEREGSIVWASPILHWTDEDMASYRAAFDVPRNEVADIIHMSGECLCGAFASPGEREEVGFFYPSFEEEISALEAEVRAAGHAEPFCIWGWGADPANKKLAKKHKAAPMCGGCKQMELDLNAA